MCKLRPNRFIQSGLEHRTTADELNKNQQINNSKPTNKIKINQQSTPQINPVSLSFQTIDSQRLLWAMNVWLLRLEIMFDTCKWGVSCTTRAFCACRTRGLPITRKEHFRHQHKGWWWSSFMVVSTGRWCSKICW